MNGKNSQKFKKVSSPVGFLEALNLGCQIHFLSFKFTYFDIPTVFAMQSAALQACKVQATLSSANAANVAPAAARASVQALRPQAPSFVKSQIVHSVRGSPISAVTEAPAPSPASPPSER
jgi:hypothetical protein